LDFVPIGEVDPEVMSHIAREAGRIYGVPVHVATEAYPLLPDTRDERRDIHLADRMLDAFQRRQVPRDTHQLGVTEAKLTVGDMNFVFGYAQMPGNSAVMSLERLRPKQSGAEAESLLRDRAVAIAVHELGHTFGFRHCQDEHCVMFYTETAAGVDRAGRQFCSRCAFRLRH
jgi:archaemetzincin